MKPVSGFDRPAVQWAFVVLSVVLMALAAAASWIARRSTDRANDAQTIQQAMRLENQQLDAQLARERSTRESLALELSRQRAGGPDAPRVMPTLTLEPAESRGAKPPAPSVAPQHATQVIELRLVLPARVGKQFSRFDIVLRDWTGGDTIWSRGGLTATTIDRRPALAAFITGDLLRTGAYELLVSGTTMGGQREEVASYEVSVK
jgi:type II secretory pathway pseudopilin PulG